MNNAQKRIDEGLRYVAGNVITFAKRIAPVYKVLEWEWAPAGGIPTIDDIESTLRTLLRAARAEIGQNREKDPSSTEGADVSTGGLSVVVSSEYATVKFEDSFQKFL